MFSKDGKQPAHLTTRPKDCNAVGRSMRKVTLADMWRKRVLQILAGAACLLLLNMILAFRFAPDPAADAIFKARAQMQTADGLVVKIAALSRDESRRSFGENLGAHEIQPVWLSIDNNTDEPLTLMTARLDPAFYSPYEVSYRFDGTLSWSENKARDDYFESRQIGDALPPHSHTEGFVYATLDSGVKFANVAITGKTRTNHFEFVLDVPGTAILRQNVSPAQLYPHETIKDLNLDELKAVLATLPCCTADAKDTRAGDPLNLVVIEHSDTPMKAFIARGWHVTDKLNVASILETMRAFLLRGEYLTSPVSSLYLFGRQEDIALQKPRATISERVHLRLWLTPNTFQSNRIWVGQISRDIGVRFTAHTWNLTTHKIAPDVDFDRDYLLQDLLLSGLIEQFGYVEGVGGAPSSEPRTNLTGDTYFTDGRRLVVFLADKQPQPAAQISGKQIWTDGASQ